MVPKKPMGILYDKEEAVDQIPNQKQVKSVTINICTVYDDGTSYESQHDYTDMRATERRGVRKFINLVTGKVEHIEPNGHGVLELTVWRGCDAPELFVANEEITSV